MSALLFILGSSRPTGNTRLAVDEVCRHVPSAEIADLGALDISFYDYRGRNREDDFLSLAQRMTRSRTIIFASPVYWYAMSAPMKTLFDRLTDLTRLHKNVGRALAGRATFLIASGTDESLPPGFEEPFRLTAAYFEMAYGGAYYSRVDRDLELTPESRRGAEEFARRVLPVR